MRFGQVGDDPRQRGLPGARGAVEDDRGKEPVSLDGPTQQTAFPYDMILADDLIQGLRPHSVRQGGFLLHTFFEGMVKEIHALILPCGR